MTWANRLKLALGLFLTVLVVAVCTFVFTQRQSQAQSTSASIIADGYPVGTDFGGVVTRQYVRVGDHVRAGERLFAVRSLELQRGLATGWTTTDALQSVTPDGTTTVSATVDGIVASIAVPQGGYASTGAVLARIYKTGTMAVTAELTLTPVDYGRLEEGATASVVLPNQSTIRGEVESIAVQTDRGQAKSTLVIVCPSLAAAVISGLDQPGTPVTATVRLRDDGPFAGIGDAFRAILHGVGM